MDVVAFLRKSGKGRGPVQHQGHGEIDKRPPIEYTAVHLVYEFTGDEAAKEEALESRRPLCRTPIAGEPHAENASCPLQDVFCNGAPCFTNKPEQVTA